MLLLLAVVVLLVVLLLHRAQCAQQQPYAAGTCVPLSRPQKQELVAAHHQGLSPGLWLAMASLKPTSLTARLAGG